MERVKNIIFNNLLLKLIAIFIAFLLWLNINLMQKTTLEFVSFIEIKNIPYGIYVKKIYPEKVIIVLEGSKKNIQNLNISKIQAYVSGNSLKEGENILNVKIKGNLKNFRVIAIKPPKVIIYAEKKLEVKDEGK